MMENTIDTLTTVADASAGEVSPKKNRGARSAETGVIAERRLPRLCAFFAILAGLGFFAAGGIWHWHKMETARLKRVVSEQQTALVHMEAERRALERDAADERMAREKTEQIALELMSAKTRAEARVNKIELEMEALANKAAEDLKRSAEYAKRKTDEALSSEKNRMAEEFARRELAVTNKLHRMHAEAIAKLESAYKAESARAQKTEAALLAYSSAKGSVSPEPGPPESGKTGPRHGDRKTIMLPGGVPMEIIYVAPGDCVYGEDRKASRIGHGFWLGKYEVTQRQWKSVMGENPSYFRGDNLPVDTISWDDCQRFVGRINATLSCGARLPTEREWEYACRAASRTEFSWGDVLNGDKANCDGTYPVGTDEKGVYLKKTVPVDGYGPNPWGFYCMHGNVREWCSDAYDTSRRVLRGGSWYHSPAKCRSAARDGSDPASKYSNFGFRICCSDGGIP